MSKSYMVITEKDWEKATPEQQSWMTFNTMQKLDARLRKVERRPIIDKVLGFGGGVIGGALAAVGINLK